MNASRHTNRFLLWVDAVGGFLACRGDRVRIGQAAPGSEVEVPLLADISRHHASIRRIQGAYLLEAVRDCTIDGRPVERLGALIDGALIRLGPVVQFRFRQPHALSATARLEFVSNHRTHPATSGVLLFADTCVLGPGPKSHVVCKPWSHDVVLYRQGDELFCRGQGIEGAAKALSLPRHFAGEDYSFSLEAL